MILKAKDKDALKHWEEHKRSIERSTIIVDDEDYTDKKKRIEFLLKPGNEAAFSKYYFPHYCEAEFGDFHKKFFKKLQSDRIYITNKWSRDHAKSVVTAVIGVVLLKQRKKIRNLLLVSHNETNAVELLTPLKLEFETNHRLKNDFGIQENPGRWEAGKFVTLDGCSFRAIGAGQSPRGTRNQEARPDIILVDDIDSEEVCRNPKRLDQLWEWVTGALYPCFSIKGRKRFIVSGNRIAKDCIVERAVALSDHSEQVDILRKEQVDPNYIKQLQKDLAKCKDKASQDFKILTECVKYGQLGYKPSWKERFTMYDCVYMIMKMPYRMSQREYFNNPLVEGKEFKKAWMQFKKLPPLSAYKFLISYLDPGFKKTETSDSKSQVLIGLYNSEFHIRKVFCGKASVEEMIEWGYETDRFVKSRHASYTFKMEEVFLQSLLYKDYAEAAKAKGYPLPVSGDKRQKPDKDSRISATSGYYERGTVFFDEDIQNEHHTLALIEQYLNFETGVKSLKDGPDAVEGAFFLLQQCISQNADFSTGSFSTNKHKM